jgi:hypothetical protein
VYAVRGLFFQGLFHQNNREKNDRHIEFFFNDFSCFVTTTPLLRTAYTMPISRSFIPSSVQLVGKDLKEQDKDAEHGDIEKRVEVSVTMIGGLDEIVAIGER